MTTQPSFHQVHRALIANARDAVKRKEGAAPWPTTTI